MVAHIFLFFIILISSVFSTLNNPKVTCGSIVKVKHYQSNRRLHSHTVRYASGSGQNSVTAFPEPGDSNSYWTIIGRHGEECEPGTPIHHNDVIRMQHVSTGGFLHSHLHKSPLTKNQEVSSFEKGDTGDNWKVLLSDNVWTKKTKVRFQHVDTDMYLYTNKRNLYSRPISGQGEVAAVKSSRDKNIYWRAEEGIYREEIEPKK